MKTNIMFRILGEELVPDMVSKHLSLQPTTAWKKGDQYHIPNVGVRQRSIGHWSLSTDGALASESVEEHAAFLLQKLESQKRAVLELMQDPRFKVAISVWWEIDEEHGSFSLSSELMSRLTALSHDIEFHFIGTFQG
jgi:hypothetical protein